jgi:hypothetical protein
VQSAYAAARLAGGKAPGNWEEQQYYWLTDVMFASFTAWCLLQVSLHGVITISVKYIWGG